MAERVLYIQGIANDGCAQAEQDDADREIRALSEAADVTVLGNAHEGFALVDVQAALRKNRAIQTLIVSAHGSIEHGGHTIFSGSSEDFGADIFYRDIADALVGRPINLFMLSCGSGAGCYEGRRNLPHGSTLINFVGEGEIDSRDLAIEGFALKPIKGLGFAENLFLNMLCRGLDGERYAPQITVSAVDDVRATTKQLWALASRECLNNHYDNLLDFIDQMNDLLVNCLTRDVLGEVFTTMKSYASAAKDPPPPLNGRHVPIYFRICEERFLDDVVKARLLGPMCAASYALHRAEIGAFQIASPGFYLTPASPRRTSRAFQQEQAAYS